MGEVPTFNELEATVSTKLIDAGNFDKAPLDKGRLNAIDTMLIESYTANGYVFFNNFLHTKNYIETEISKGLSYDINKLLNIFTKKIVKNPGETDIAYNTKIAYYLFINLYATIEKYPKSLSPFKVYRGSKSHYLNDDPNKKFYTNSFFSTTYGNPMDYTYRYIFYVHPLCNYINLDNTSVHKFEKEVLFSPYHRYRYIKEEPIGTKKTYHYTLLPIDIDIPNTVEEFIPFRDSHITIHGGKNLKSHTVNNLVYKMNNINTGKTFIPSMVGKTAKTANTTNTAKTTRTAKNRNQSNFMKRMDLEIKSFGGGPFTEKEKKMSDDLVAYFEKI